MLSLCPARRARTRARRRFLRLWRLLSWRRRIQRPFLVIYDSRAKACVVAPKPRPNFRESSHTRERERPRLALALPEVLAATLPLDAVTAALPYRRCHA
jgi:hypothetical protein